MDLIKQIEDAQSHANKLAIQETNIREQLSSMETLTAQLEQVIRAKHQAIGYVNALKVLAEQQARQQAADQDKGLANVG